MTDLLKSGGSAVHPSPRARHFGLPCGDLARSWPGGKCQYKDGSIQTARFATPAKSSSYVWITTSLRELLNNSKDRRCASDMSSRSASPMRTKMDGKCTLKLGECACST